MLDLIQVFSPHTPHCTIKHTIDLSKLRIAGQRCHLQLLYLLPQRHHGSPNKPINGLSFHPAQETPDWALAVPHAIVDRAHDHDQTRKDRHPNIQRLRHSPPPDGEDGWT